MKMTFPQFQDSKIHVTDDEQKQAIIYLQNSDDYDPSNHYSNYWHIEITDNGYLAMVDRSVYETMDLKTIELALYEKLIEWGALDD